MYIVLEKTLDILTNSSNKETYGKKIGGLVSVRLEGR